MTKNKATAEVERELSRYRQFMLKNEYSVRTVTQYSKCLLRFLYWQARNDENSMKKLISDFLEVSRTHDLITFKNCRAALYQYFKMVTGKSYPKRPLKESNPRIEAILSRFYNYSVNIKRINVDSGMWETVTVRGFLEYITDKDQCSMENITAHNIREYVTNNLAHLTDSSKGRYITAIRNFFRYQQFEGTPVHRSVFRLPLSPAVWKNSSFPKTINEAVFNGLHEIPDSKTPIGKRDRCIMLCFTELALRCVETAALSIDDFNWREGSVAIKNTKNHLDRKLPVSQKLGKAIVEYLKNARPQTTNRILFVRFKHTFGEPMGVSQIRGVVRRVYAKSGANIDSTGPHILRRTAASKIYNADNSLKMTADILGHESLDSTVLYVKTDITRLREVAAPWLQEKAGTHHEK